MITKDFKKWIRDEVYRQAPINICVIDRDNRIVEANDNFISTFGATGKKFCYEAYKNRDSVCPNCQSAKTFADGKVRISQEFGLDKDGKEIHYIVHLAPIVEEDGSIPYVIEMSTDISEMIGLQQRLRRQQEDYRLLFNEVPCFISIQDRDFNLIETNRLFKEYFGESNGRPCYEVYKQRSEQCYPCPVAETFNDGEVHRNEDVLTSRDGERVNVICYTAPIRDDEGNIVRVMEMSTDITQIRQLQSQLTSIGLLVSSISHGIKGLLMGLDGGIYAVDTGFEKDKPDRVQHGWNMVKRNVNKIRSMVLNILYYAKDRELEWETLKLESFLTDIFALMESRAKELGVEFEKQIDPGAGEIEADPQAVRTMLVNILENAFDACRIDSAKENHKVTLGVKAANGSIIFTVTDNGIGMDQETRNKIFTLFFSSKGSGGTGLGLFISNKIVAKHGGNIRVDSQEGEGTLFEIEMPRKKTPVKLPEEETGIAERDDI